MVTWQLGPPESGLKRKAATSTTNLTNFQPNKKLYLRISAPTHYRCAFLNEGTQDFITRVLAHIASWRQVPTPVLTGGSWKWECGQCSEQLVGHVRMPPENATKLEACSGKSGIFITRTNIHEKGEEVIWLPRESQEDKEAYHTRILALAGSRNQSVKYRRSPPCADFGRSGNSC